MRRAALAIVLCAAPVLAATAHASTDPKDRVALRALLQQGARASAAGAVRIPLPDAPRGPDSAGSRESGHVERTTGRASVLVGVRRHSHRAAVAAEIRSLGGEAEEFGTIGVIAATVPSGSALVSALRDDARVDYIERNRELRVAADPFDVLDPDTGLKFTWAYDTVHAADALAAAGGGSSRTVAVIDTGLDVTHAEFQAGQVDRTFNTSTGGPDVTDTVGHGTFVSGLISATDGNGVGGKGVAGSTRLVAVNAERVCDDGTRGCFAVDDLVDGIEFAIRSGADVLNMSLAGEGFTRTQARALEAAFFNDVLPVAASGNNAQRPQDPNPLEFPAGAIGGMRGARGIGLSVAATMPDGRVAPFSDHNDFVSLAAPGASGSDCRFGVFSTLPSTTGTEWDVPGSCSRVIADAQGNRFAYGEGTSFSAPIVSGIAALVWQVEPRLASEQVGEVLTNSAHQTTGGGWNEFTGRGVVDGQAATALARTYDVTEPRARGRARRRGNRVRVKLGRTSDRTERGRQLAGRVTYGLLVSRDNGRNFRIVKRGRPRPFSVTVKLRGRRANALVATACDGNGNCGLKRLGRFKRR